MRRSVGSYVLRAAGVGLALALGLTYVGAWYDLVMNGQTADPAAALAESLSYWATSVLPYWWLPALLLVIASAAIDALWGLKVRLAGSPIFTLSRPETRARRPTTG